MKMRLKVKQQIPYGGSFNIDRPDLHVVGRGLQFANLVESVKAYRQANNLPIGLEFEDEVERAACMTYPVECEHVDLATLTIRNLNMSDIVVGTKVLAAFLRSGRKVVSQAEADRRAKICSTCPMNRTFSKPCTGLCSELAALTTGQHTAYDSKLHGCQICRCFLSAAVHVPLEVQLPPLSEEQHNQFNAVTACWKKMEYIDRAA